jgi:DNA-binding SARP family transcriptional activator
LTDADIEDLRRGLELYKSDLLRDITDDWALRVREKHRRDYLNVLWRLMQLAVIRRDYGEGIRHAQTILDNDALREDVHRELMQLFVLNGQRAHALRQFEHCRDLLRRELAIHPMRETMALYQKIATSAISSEPPPAPAATPAVILPAMAPDRDAHDLIDAARRHLAAADSQLQLSLQLIDR